MNEKLAATDLVTFPPSPLFPVKTIELERSHLCWMDIRTSEAEQRVELFEYLWTENTREIHATLMGMIEQLVYVLREEGHHEMASRWWTLRSLARFNLHYRPQLRDTRERHSDRHPLRRLSASEMGLWNDDLATFKAALNAPTPRLVSEGFSRHALQELLFEARYPDDSAMRGEPPEDIERFVEEVLVGELKDGRPFVKRLEQRGRRDPEIGRRLRRTKILAERANIHLVGLTFEAILRQIAPHLHEAERRWFAFRFLPNSAFGGTVVEFDPVLSPLLGLEHDGFAECAIRVFALGDESCRERLEVILKTYLWAFPIYADTVIQRVREVSQQRRGALITNSDAPRSGGLDQMEWSGHFENLISKARARQIDAADATEAVLCRGVEQAGLTAREREVFTLRLEDLRESEIGRRLGISQQVVSRRLQSAIKKVRNARERDR